MSSAVESKIASAVSYLNPADAANYYADYLKREKGCDEIICLTHLGYEGDFYTDQELALHTSNVDYIVGGHSHTFLDDAKVVADRDGKPVVIMTDGIWGVNFGKFRVR